MQPKYFSVDEMIQMIDEPNRSACFKILKNHLGLFQKVPGATHNHQAWPGGYYDHVQEIMNCAEIYYNFLNPIRPLPFSLSDTLLVVFLHDIEKPWKYEIGPDGELQHKASLNTKDAEHEFRFKKLNEYGIKLTSEQENGMKYIEGEKNDYSNRKRTMGSLAAFCHLCDITSARIWFDHPKEENDSWNGAKRRRYPQA